MQRCTEAQHLLQDAPVLCRSGLRRGFASNAAHSSQPSHRSPTGWATESKRPAPELARVLLHRGYELAALGLQYVQRADAGCNKGGTSCDECVDVSWLSLGSAHPARRCRLQPRCTTRQQRQSTGRNGSSEAEMHAAVVAFLLRSSPVKCTATRRTGGQEGRQRGGEAVAQARQALVVHDFAVPRAEAADGGQRVACWGGWRGRVGQRGIGPSCQRALCNVAGIASL